MRTAAPLQAIVLGALAEQARPLPDSPERAYLEQGAAQLGETPWQEALRRALEKPAPEDEALVRLAETLALSEVELLACAVARAADEALMIGCALGWLQSPVGDARATLALLGELGAALGATEPVAAIAAGPARECGLLGVGDPERPLLERSIRLPEPVVFALRGAPSGFPGCELGGPARIPMPPALIEEARRHARALVRGERPMLVIRSGHPEEGRALAAVVSEALGRRPGFVATTDTNGLTPWLELNAALPVFVAERSAEGCYRPPVIPGWRHAAVVIAAPDHPVEARGATALSWTPALPAADARATLWEDALGDPALARELGTGHRHSPGRIHEIAGLARQRARVAGRDQPDAGDVFDGSWSGAIAALGSMALPATDRVGDDAFVAPEAVRRDLDLLVSRCHDREGAADPLGPAARARYRPGVRALFTGPSGTGKTLAASWLATRLSLPLFRVDLAAVLSKYIGETERNLSELLTRAEACELVLLFDEADSMFGRRTDVQHSNDRFANGITNFLLQRVESYDGIVLLTSNSRQRFDEALIRRLDVIIEFASPQAEERRALWNAHLGADHSLSAMELNTLASLAELSGGELRNAVLAASVFARRSGAALGWAEILAGLEVEYRKLGQPLPTGLRAPPRAADG